ncbi:cytidylate kinase family protein [Candidatus Marsarchaeota archaeon]|jgi:predicted cytidylate kinase|nr:cytidylate kinase family protein [Candidatus Marsarchaeota archaeon]MCL5090030.1 cytidylate kinase family protein [Candidatus Marsarchaeota archaeon]
MIKICISGLASSGKTALGEILAERLNILHIKESYKDSTNGDEEIISLLKELTAKNDKKFAEIFDNKVRALADQGNCVVTTWLGSWIIKDATIRVWLNASIEERARRRAKKNNTKYASTLSFIRDYDRLTINHFENVYGIDVTKHGIFDLELNTEKLSIDEMVEIISLITLSRENSKFL